MSADWANIVGYVVSGAAFLVSVGQAIQGKSPERQTALPPAPVAIPPPAPSQPNSELESVKADVKELKSDFRELKELERETSDAAAEFRGEMRAKLARIFERLKIRNEDRNDRSSE